MQPVLSRTQDVRLTFDLAGDVGLAALGLALVRVQGIQDEGAEVDGGRGLLHVLGFGLLQVVSKLLLIEGGLQQK